MPPYRARQNDPLEIASSRYEIRDLVAMGNPLHILLDNRPIIQLLGNVVAGRPDQFHAARVRRMVWFGPGKRRQKGMVDVNDGSGISRYEFRTQNLHVARQHD